MTTRRRSRSRVGRLSGSLNSLLGKGGSGSSLDCKHFSSHLTKSSFWIFLLLAGVAAFISFGFYKNAYEKPWFAANMKGPEFSPQENAFAIINVSFYAIIAYAGYRSWATTKSFKSIPTLMFIMVSALNIIYPWLLLTDGDDKNRKVLSFWALVTLAIAVLWWMWMLWSKDVTAATGLMFYFLWLVYLMIWHGSAIDWDVTL